jgi:D-alanyl-D-alanine carboxypeptidase
MKWFFFLLFSPLFGSFSPDILAQLDQAFEQAYVQNRLVGLIASVFVGDQQIWVKTKGISDIPARRPIYYSDTLRIGSISKTFATTVLLQLVDEGLITLDESIARFNLGVPNSNNITIRMLCNHTSGLYNYTEDPNFTDALIAAPWRAWTPQELVNVAIAHPPLFPPGTQVQYNNTNFILQGMIIEQLTGLSLARQIQSRIVQRLGLSSTSLPFTPYLSGQFSRGYFIESPATFDFTVLNPTGSLGAGGMISCLRDLKTWARALARGELLTPATQAQRLIRVAPSPIPGPFQGPYLRYGLGIEQLGNFALDEQNVFLGHEGDIICYNCSINYLPSQDTTFIVLINRNPQIPFPSDNATTLFMALARILYPSNCPWPYPYLLEEGNVKIEDPPLLKFRFLGTSLFPYQTRHLLR